ncbi:MAG: hypothetical protein ABI675_07505 [Chitinophagaceae bacterium]
MKKPLLSALWVIAFSFMLHAQPCTPQGDEVSYGLNDTWIGYVYDNADITNYHSYINEGTPGNPNFDQSFGGDNVMYPTNGCSVQTETFSVRYKLAKTFANGVYDFTVGGDDGFRLSLDGGNTWIINRWNDQGYTTTTYTATLNGAYNLVLEYYENGGGNRVSFNVVAGCSGAENTAVYGTNDVWNGYVYDGTNFNTYKGMVHQGSLGAISFDQDFGGSNTLYATSGCNVQTETFSVRYKLNKNFANGNYNFVVGGDDGYRLSFDGGNTWAINRWWDQSYSTASYNSDMYGNYNIVLEFYENGGDNRISLDMQANIILKIDLLSFSGRRDANAVLLNWDISADSDPLNFEIERSKDGRSFERIQTIAGSNNLQYFYKDENSLDGSSFYRLKMTDQQGKTSYSYIVAISESDARAGELILFPTIVNNGAIYCRSGKLINKASVRVTDIYGRLVQQQLIGKIEKGQTVGISLGSYKLSKGIYLVSILDNDQPILTQKIIL